MIKLANLLIVVILLTGCSQLNAFTYRKDTSKALKNECAPGEITIINQSSIWGEPAGSYSWYAKCHGKTYRCHDDNAPKGMNDRFLTVKCHEAPLPNEVENINGKEVVVNDESSQ